MALPSYAKPEGPEGKVGAERTVSRMSRKFKKKHARYERPHIITPNLRPIGTVLCSRAVPLAAHHCLCARAAGNGARTTVQRLVSLPRPRELREGSSAPTRTDQRAERGACIRAAHIAQLCFACDVQWRARDRIMTWRKRRSVPLVQKRQASRNMHKALSENGAERHSAAVARPARSRGRGPSCRP